VLGEEKSKASAAKKDAKDTKDGNEGQGFLFDFASLRGETQLLGYCSLSGFGQNGPWRGTPALNADGRAILRELGFAHDEVERILRSATARGAAGVRGGAGVKG
jgi:crotonobetainyl-CoA:carnitine CoA-transferase CaiB-like acyl-CoA transferase